MVLVTTDDRVTAAERYAIATSTSDLSQSADKRCDADKLIAAGWVTQGDPRRSVALDLYRMAVTGNTNGLSSVVDTMDGWLNGKLLRRGGKTFPKHQRREMVVSVLRWWLHPTCGYCEGRCFELLGDDDTDGARALSTKHCPACHGTGKRPVEREVPNHMRDQARMLADQLDSLVLLVTGEMARVLAGRMPDLGMK